MEKGNVTCLSLCVHVHTHTHAHTLARVVLCTAVRWLIYYIYATLCDR